MLRRPLGNSGLEVSVVGLGTWAMSGTEDSWGLVDDRESMAAIHQALDAGINLIDTAPIYGLGHAEEIVGKAIQARRHDVVLATKCGLLFPHNADEFPPRCLAPESIIRECEDSLRRLRVETIDLYQCHWPDPRTPIRATMEAMRQLLDQGKVRAIGVSNFDVEQVAAAREFAPVCSVQAPFSLLNRRAADDLFTHCAEHDVAVLAYSPLAKGLLTGKFRPGDRPGGVRHRDPEFVGGRFLRNLRTLDGLKELAATHGRSVAQLAINWVIGHRAVCSAIVGAKRPSQVLENVGGAGWEMPPELRHEIDALLTRADHAS